MILYFVLLLFLTFLIVRLSAYLLHDRENYGSKRERSKTITGWIRRRTGHDWHHFHFGLILIIFDLILIVIFGLGRITTAILAIGLSMFIDQGVPIIYRKSNYFHKNNFFISLVFHIIVSLVAYLFFGV